MVDKSKLEKIFEEARELPAGERAGLVEGACGDDNELRERVEELLAADAEAGRFLETSDAVPDINAHEGQTIGRYKLLELLGEGGFGSVWMAEQREPVKRRVALKIIKLGMDTKQVIARFEAERQALALMDHPNIARVLDAGSTDQGRPYFVMELVRGVPIPEYCDREKLDTESRLRLFTQICHAIQHAHQKGIIHRDIKPNNVLVTLHDGVPVVKVIDFGIAKATNSELTTKTLFTQHRQMIGTPAYMSPEQAEMSGLDIDTRSDVYSLGVLLYELLTGATPFDTSELQNAGFMEMMRIIRETEPPRPSTRFSPMSDATSQIADRRRVDAARLGMILRGDLDWIIMKCLEKDRTRRYETANGLALDIERYLDDEPVSASPPTTAYRVRKFIRRNRTGVMAAGGIAAALLIGVVGTTLGLMWALDQKERAETAEDLAKWLRSFGRDASVAVLPLANESDPSEDYFAAGVTSALASDLSRISALRIVSEESTLSVVEKAGAELSLRDIAAQLGVYFLVTGSVRKQGTTVHLSIQLTHAVENKKLLDREYEKEIENLEALEHGVSRDIVTALQLELTEQEQQRLATARSIKPEALTAYMLGLHKLRIRTLTSSRRALEYFDKATAIEPRYAAAYAGKARAYTTIDNQFERPHDIMPLAREAALKAMDIDPTLSEAHAAYGHVKLNYDWEWQAAGEAFQKAIALNEDYAAGYVGYAMYLAAMNRRDEVVEYLEKALAIDPMCLVTAPEGGVYVASYMAREYEYTIELCETAIDLDPDYWGHRTWFALALAEAGRMDRALEQAETAYGLVAAAYERNEKEHIPPLAVAVLGHLSGRAGNVARAKEMQQKLAKMRSDGQFVCPYEQGTIEIALGNIDKAFELMKEAIKEQSACIPWLQADPRLDTLRPDERFDDLLEASGHTDTSR